MTEGQSRGYNAPAGARVGVSLVAEGCSWSALALRIRPTSGHVSRGLEITVALSPLPCREAISGGGDQGEGQKGTWQLFLG